MLRKLDQEENFMRSKNFHNLYKQKLAERILEKASRVNKSAYMWGELKDRLADSRWTYIV